MKHLNTGVFLLALATLIAELSLVRVFDALFYPGIAYMILSSALFGLGLGGIYASLRPLNNINLLNVALSRWSVLFAITVFMIRPVMNFVPFDFNGLFQEPIIHFIYFAIIYLSLLLPFFFAGLVLTSIYTAFSDNIRTLYFWDLLGAAVAGAIIIPVIPIIGPGGLLFCAAALGFIVSALFYERRNWSLVAAVIVLVLIVLPLFKAPQYYDFVEHQGKRGVQWARTNGWVVDTIWDPISKIDVIDYQDADARLQVMYDGGSQQTSLIPFDGNFEELEVKLADELRLHFWQRGVLASHYHFRNKEHSVLVIGSAGGQEVKAALLFDASQVDGIELVGSVVELAGDEYSTLIGDIYNHPNVNIQVGEGRSFLRATDSKYDIIQIFSNHTSSSIAAGGEAIATVYLPTVEAYKEYFGHLTDNGVLHINHHNYSRMVTTAAQAWAEMGRTDFQSHVLVFQRDQDVDTLPTLLIKNKPWTENEVAELEEFFFANFPGEDATYYLAENPIDPTKSLLTNEYYAGNFSPEFLSSVDTRIKPATDNLPYFNFGYKSIFQAILTLPQRISVAQGSIGVDVIPFAITGMVSIFYAGIFTLAPLIFSEAGKSKWSGKGSTLVYFSCLGAGFIIIEIVLIQLFFRLIGSPLHTYTSVIASILVGAGIGSATSGRLGITLKRRWFWPFVGILLTIIILIIAFPHISRVFLAEPLMIRILISIAVLFPVGFFLGMPFPLGVSAIREQPQGAIPWAWGMNGLFTVIGSLSALIISVQWGFNVALLFALILYVIAFVMFSRLRLIL